MVKGIGIDIESMSRIGLLLRRYDSHTLRLIFTAGELERCHHAQVPALYLAVCFSAKEAMGKALGTGLATIDWNDIEAGVLESRVVFTLHGHALRQATYLGATQWQGRWSIWHDHVVVVVVIQ